MRSAILGAVLTATGACTGPSAPPTPAKATTESTATMTSPTSPAKDDAERKVVVGVARNVKGGAALVGDDGKATRIDGLDEWPKDLVDRRVVAEGHMKKRTGPSCASDPVLPCQGIVGDYWVLSDAKFRLE